MLTRRRLVEELRAELADSRRRELELVAALARQERRTTAARRERDEEAMKRAKAEAKLVGDSLRVGMCHDRSTCLANTDAAAKWRRAVDEGWVQS